MKKFVAVVASCLAAVSSQGFNLQETITKDTSRSHTVEVKMGVYSLDTDSWSVVVPEGRQATVVVTRTKLDAYHTATSSGSVSCDGTQQLTSSSPQFRTVLKESKVLYVSVTATGGSQLVFSSDFTQFREEYYTDWYAKLSYTIDVTYADLEPEKSGFVVKYDANGGAGQMGDQAFEGDVLQLAPNAFTRTGYVFVGWSRHPGETPCYADGSTVTKKSLSITDPEPYEELTLYAAWGKELIGAADGMLDKLYPDVVFYTGGTDGYWGEVSPTAVRSQGRQCWLAARVKGPGVFSFVSEESTGGDGVACFYGFVGGTAGYAGLHVLDLRDYGYSYGKFSKSVDVAENVEAVLGWEWYSTSGGSMTLSGLEWKQNVSVALDARGGVVMEDSLARQVGGTYGTLPTATKRDDAFLGWFTEPSGGVKVESDTVVTRDVTVLYAHWSSDSPSEPTPSDTASLSFSLSGAQWHKVSFNVLPDDPSPSAVFGPVASKIESVVKGSDTRFWMPGNGGSLEAVEIGAAYWVLTTDPSVAWAVTGTPHPETEIRLNKGWTMIGYALAKEGVVANVLKTALATGKIEDIVDETLFYPGSLTTMKPGRAYWVNAAEAMTFRYDAVDGRSETAVKPKSMSSSAAAPVYGPFSAEEETEAFAQRMHDFTPTMVKAMAVTIDGEPAKEGDAFGAYVVGTDAFCGDGKAFDGSGKMSGVLYVPSGAQVYFKVWKSSSGMTDPKILTSDAASALTVVEAGKSVTGHVIAVKTTGGGDDDPPVPTYGPFSAEEETEAFAQRMHDYTPTMVKAMAVTIDGEPAKEGDAFGAYVVGTDAFCGDGKAFDGSGKMSGVLYVPSGAQVYFKVWRSSSGLTDPVILTSDTASALTVVEAGKSVTGHVVAVKTTGGGEDDPPVPTYGPFSAEEETEAFAQRMHDYTPTMVKAMAVTIDGDPAKEGDAFGAYVVGTDAFCGDGKAFDGSGKMSGVLYVPSGAKVYFKVWRASSGMASPEILTSAVADALTVSEAGKSVTGYAVAVKTSGHDDPVEHDLLLNLSGAGWHEVSFSVLPEDGKPENVFAPVSDKIGNVTCGSKNWSPTTGGTLTALEIGKGYWVQMTAENVSWTVTGQGNPGVEIALKPGWNLIGYPLLEEGEVETVLATALATEKIDWIYSGSRVYPGTLTTMAPGKGYWVYANAAVTIRFDAK